MTWHIYVVNTETNGKFLNKTTDSELAAIEHIALVMRAIYEDEKYQVRICRWEENDGD